MPNIKSAKKRAQLSTEHREANRAKRSELRTHLKKVAASISAQSDDARAEMAKAAKKLDQAAAAGLIHKRTAARRKSRLAKKINAQA